MKKHFYLLKTCLCALAVGVLAGCSAEEDGPQVADGEGLLRLDIEAATAFKTTTRAIDEAEYKNTDNYTIKITNVSSEGEVYNGKLSEMELPMNLTVGAYNVLACYGEEFKDADATAEGFYVEGTTTIQVESGKDATAKVTCGPVSAAKVTVIYDKALDEYFSNYTTSFTTAALTANKKVAVWGKADTDPLYLKVNTNEKITGTLSFTPKSDSNVEPQTMTVNPTLSPGQWYEVSVKPKESTSTDGTLNLTITISSEVETEEIDITIPADWV